MVSGTSTHVEYLTRYRRYLS